MGLRKRKLLYTGKVKSMYATDDPNFLIAKFRDDTTAFDGEKQEKFRKKGIINNKINACIMQMLKASNIPTHFEYLIAPSECIVRRLEMIPLECVVRNIAAGSICRRLAIKNGLQLNPPLYELFLKNDTLHDPMINDNHALAFGWANQEQLDLMRELSLKINNLLVTFFLNANLILVDAKYEFGISCGKIFLGDEISPDSCRIWDVNTKESLDKDRFRKDLGHVIESYAEIARRLQIPLN